LKPLFKGHKNNIETFTDPRDGKKYKTLKIGKQIWLAQNLSYNAKGSQSYANKSANAKKYGRLYTWQAAIKACPKGWHLPCKTDWENLIELKAIKTPSFAPLLGGYHITPDGFEGLDEYGYWWSTSECNRGASAYCVNVASNDDIIFLDTSNKSRLLSVRCIKDEDV